MEITEKKVTASFIWKVLERIASQGINLVVQIVLARILLPEDFGSLAIIVAITNFAMLFVQSGLSTALIRKENIDQQDVSTVLTASIVVATLLYIVLFFLAPFLAYFFEVPSLVWPIRLLSIVLFLNAVNGVQTALFTRKFKFKQVLIKSLVSVTISGIIGIWMAYSGYGIWSLIVQNIVCVALTVVVMLFGLDFKLKPGFNWEKAKSLYSFGGKILLTNVINGLYDALRTFTIGKKYSKESLAYYDKAYTYSYYVNQIVNSSLSSVLLPTFSSKQKDGNGTLEMARKSVRITSFVMMPVLFGCAAISSVAIPFLLTDKWIACVPFFMIFCFLRIPEIIKTIDIQVYYSLGKSGLHLMYTIIMSLCSIIALFIGVFINVMAIAIGALIIEYISLVIVSIISSKTYGYTIKMRIKDMIKPIINSTIMALIVYLIGLDKAIPIISIFKQILTGAFIYFFLAFVTNDNGLKEVLKIIKSLGKGKFYGKNN